MNSITKQNGQNEKLIYPAASRNSQPILDVLKETLVADEPNGGADRPRRFLEISSGSGQHIAYFAPHFRHINFQPSEYESSLLSSISAHVADSSAANLYQPVLIDIQIDCNEWTVLKKPNTIFHALTDIEGEFDYVFNANMMHIAPFSCTQGLFKNCSRILRSGGLLITYGPYAENGVLNPQSNIDFDRTLRAQNPEWGYRDIAELKMLGHSLGLILEKCYEMPANNKILIWRKL